MIEINGESLTLKDVKAVAIDREKIELNSEKLKHCEKIRTIVEEISRGKRAVYGINTGVGKLSEKKIPIDDIETLQLNIVRSHAVGVGAPLEPEFVRAAMLLRANTLIKGHSGVRPEVLSKIRDFLNSDIIPYVPRKGSVGASGDLAPLAHIALSLVGEGFVLRDKRKIPTKQVMKDLGIEPLKLKAKEGLSLINGTQVSSAIISLILQKSLNLLHAATFTGALIFDAQFGVLEEFDERISEIRKHKGQAIVAAMLRKLTAGSELTRNRQKVQDAYSIRCMPQVHGAVLDMLLEAQRVMEIEINSVTDNPVVFDNKDIISNGNFHGQYPAFAGDIVGMALTTLSSISERRTFRILTPELSMGLPPFLSENSGVNSGLMMMQVTQSSLVANNKILAHPASIDSIPTSGDQEDSVSQSQNAALKLLEIYNNTLAVVAIELIAGLQAIRLRGIEKTSPIIAHTLKTFSRDLPFIEQDRFYNADIENAMKIIERTNFKTIPEVK